MLFKEGGESGGGGSVMSLSLLLSFWLLWADLSGDEMAGAVSQLLCGGFYQLSVSAAASQVGKVTMA